MRASKLSVVLVGSAVSLGLLAGAAQADVVNGGFEIMTVTTGTLPDGAGYWRGDRSNIVEAENDITPWEGVQMLRFQNTHRNGASSAVGGELWQVIDVSSFQQAIRSGIGSVSASAFFNRVSSDLGPVDTMFSLGMYAYSGDASTFPTQWGSGELASRQSTIFTDGSAETWEQALVEMLLPTATDFVVIRISATENIFNDLSGSEFHGHYADGVEFQIIPAPSALVCLLPVALMGIGRRRRAA
ncbi:MAG: hypothetical protein KJZ69_11085 [Phycisphaerales bacterium]|nr:hypothetical protein [Phycisphaerales bacterium]